jgi:hypothetical protein
MSQGKLRNDMLDIAAVLLRAVGLFCLLALGFIGIDSLMRESGPTTQDEVLRAIGLSAPALLPSGRPMRNWDTLDPRVDLRFSPLLPSSGIDPADMVMGSNR